MIEKIERAQMRLQALYLGCRSVNVGVKFLNRLPNHLRLGHNEISQIIVVCFGVEERPAIFGGRFFEDAGYRDKLKKPITFVQHSPIKKSASGPAIAIEEWMIVSQPEVENDSPHHWVNEKTRCLAI